MRELKYDIEKLKTYANGCFYCQTILDYINNEIFEGFKNNTIITKNNICKAMVASKKMTYKTALKHIEELVDNDYLINETTDFENGLIEYIKNIPTRKQQLLNPLKLVSVSAFKAEDDKEEAVEYIKNIFHKNNKNIKLNVSSNIIPTLKRSREIDEIRHYESLDDLNDALNKLLTNASSEHLTYKELKKSFPELLDACRMYFPEKLKQLKKL